MFSGSQSCSNPSLQKVYTKKFACHWKSTWNGGPSLGKAWIAIIKKASLKSIQVCNYDDHEI